VSDFLTLGGRVRCEPCQTIALKTDQRCRCPAVRGTTLCANHRPSGRGPLTEEGKAKCAAAKTVHGRETRQKRAYISTKMAELYELETLGRKIGLISGPKTAGRKPNSFNREESKPGF